MTINNERMTCPRCLAVFRTRMQHCPIDGSELSPLPADPLLGVVLRQRYVIDSVIDDGHLARTYLATEVGTGDRVAVKVMYGDFASSVRHRARFLREMSIGSRVQHPNVLGVIDAGETTTSLPFVVTPFVPGPALSEIIRQDAPLSARRVRVLLTEIAAGLQHLHDCDVLLRGLTSDAIRIAQVAETETALITSMAFATNAPGFEVGEPPVTRPGKLVGDPRYMSPEQIGASAMDHRSDLYSLGVVAYEMLSGKAPFDGSPVVVATEHLSSPPPSISERVPGLEVDAALEALALRLLAKKPADRYPSAMAVADALGALKVHTD